MLRISHLSVDLLAQEGQSIPILHDISFSVPSGEIHALLGENGSGKSTLANALMGAANLEPHDHSEVLLDGESILPFATYERAQRGMFLTFQAPPAIPGLPALGFLRAMYNARQTARGEVNLDAFDFMEHLRPLAEGVGFPEALLKRGVNEGFSGGERKKFEILSFRLLAPKIIILDELDSGLDVDVLKQAAEQVRIHVRGGKGDASGKHMIGSSQNQGSSALVITHNPVMLRELQVDQVHVLKKGRLVQSGGKELIETLEAGGYQGLYPQESSHAN